ncbi:MAG TPA: acetyltransferase [Pseudobdellovibrionaceae bacterium]|nr:acetyltransferase [Pseudobdellovibrionaceae bacterium]
MKNIYLIGGGGHCRSCIDVIEQEGRYQIKGIFDALYPQNKDVFGFPIIGKDEDIEKYVSPDNYFLITIGQIKNSEVRVKFFELLKGLEAQFATVISPRAYVSKHSRIGEGTIVMHGALVNANSVVERNCIINTNALIEHDVFVGDHCHIATAAVINGHCTVNDRSFVGSNSVFKQGISIAPGSIIQAGSVQLG